MTQTFGDQESELGPLTLIKPGAVVVPAELCAQLYSLVRPDTPVSRPLADLLDDLRQAAMAFDQYRRRDESTSRRIADLEQQVARFREITPPSEAEVTAKEASGLLNLSVRRVQQLIKDSRLPARRAGGQWWLTLSAVESYRQGVMRGVGRATEDGFTSG